MDAFPALRGTFDRKGVGTIHQSERQDMGFNIRAEAAKVACIMLRFRRMKTLQAFALVHASFHNHFNQERHLTDRETFKVNRSAALAEWRMLAA